MEAQLIDGKTVAAQSLADGMGGVHAYVRILSSIRLASGIPERILKSEQY